MGLYTHFRRNFFFLSLLFSTFLSSACRGRQVGQEVEEAPVGLSPEDWEEDDTLVYDIPDAPLTDAVDESFPDFLYTFLNRKSFLQQRAAYPVEVTDGGGQVLEVLRNGRSVSQAVQLDVGECFFMLVGVDVDPYDYLGQDAFHAEISQVDLSSKTGSVYLFDKMSDQWNITGIRRGGENGHPAFLDFYHRFATDSIFQSDHLASEIFVSLPNEEDDVEEVIEGNIDSGQWEVFAPELPHGTLHILEMGQPADDSRGIKLVKCSVASSMMEILTFEREGHDWKLVRYEE